MGTVLSPYFFVPLLFMIFFAIIPNMSKGDKIWLAAGIPVFIFIILFMSRTFQWDKSVNGRTFLATEKYSISLKGGHLRSFWRNFYKIKKDSPSEDLFIRVVSPENMIYAMVNFDIKGIDPDRVEKSGAAFSETDKYSDGIKFTIRAGSRKDVIIRIAEKGR
ncbi:MAG: hypothetical protein COT16_00135 [Elusimicrobia bacterium CG08_land_8_20_14_0_20_44_26]|nr:MAG: hypothetical protein COT16_00135 [Elusimicrobia bacterium CG08_land_8_20_14_0_20_44_26]